MDNLLSTLNENQYKVATAIEGATMVEAGPGTGKTHTLSSRIANMLSSKDHQIEPHSVLCLTFTDSGSVAMRQRLLKLIGPTAYQLTISTFHAFCNDVIQNNQDYFGLRDMEAVSQLERISIVEDIIDSLSIDHPLKRTKGDFYFDVPRLLATFDMMKQENLSFDNIKQVTQEYIDSMPELDEYIYKRGNLKKGIQKGDVNTKKVATDKEKLDKFIAAAGLFNIYQTHLQRRKRYDFSDMLLFTIRAFEDNQSILLDYQERFQYVLVDEFQDTSGSQMEIVNKLMSYWDNPNLMCVYDKKQTIYSFSGARIKNIFDTIEKYNPSIVNLNINYRSHQDIIDSATQLINNAPLFIEAPAVGVNKNKSLVNALAYKNHTHETAHVYSMIQNLVNNGESPDRIAVIYRKHAHAEGLLKLCYQNNIPVNTKRRINILTEPVIKQVISILAYLISPAKNEKNDEFFRILHYDFLNIPRKQIERLLILLQSGGAITDLDARSFKQINQVITLLNDLEHKMHNLSVIQLLEQIFYSTGIRDVIVLNTEKRKTECLKTFFNWVSDECIKDPDYSIDKLMVSLKRMQHHKLSLEIEDVIAQEKGVMFTTAHGSKGLEFKYVFIIRCNRSDWEKSRSNITRFTMPPTLTHSTTDDKEDEMRRLFFVAMTRAENYLYMSHSLTDGKGKDLEPSQFLLETLVSIDKAPDEDIFMDVIELMSPDTITFSPQVEKEKLQLIIEHYRLSPTHLNLYLKCPLSFYYEKILKVPYVPVYAALYGSACHYAIDKAYHKAKHDLSNVNNFVEDAINYINNKAGMLSNKERNLIKSTIENILPDFYIKHFIPSTKIVSTEYKAQDILINGVPCYGEIDKLTFSGLTADIDDYKSGKASNVKKKMTAPKNGDNGGDIWRQLIFYKLLIDEDSRKNWTINSLGVVTIDKEPERLLLEYDESDLIVVKNQIKEAYDGIKNLQFNGCGDPECKWCSIQN